MSLLPVSVSPMSTHPNKSPKNKRAKPRDFVVDTRISPQSNIFLDVSDREYSSVDPIPMLSNSGTNLNAAQDRSRDTTLKQPGY